MTTRTNIAPLMNRFSPCEWTIKPFVFGAYDLIRKTMPKGYTWNDVLNGKLHIHHIIPKRLFKYTNSDQAPFKACWALNNLKLLRGGENVSIGGKYNKPLQLLLPI
jgi:hypothetical protein